MLSIIFLVILRLWGKTKELQNTTYRFLVYPFTFATTLLMSLTKIPLLPSSSFPTSLGLIFNWEQFKRVSKVWLRISQKRDFERTNIWNIAEQLLQSVIFILIANIQIYLSQENYMHEYPNIFISRKWYKQISEYIHIKNQYQSKENLQVHEENCL